MKTRKKSLFSAILSGILTSGLLFAVIFSGQAYAIITVIDDNVVAVRGWDMASCAIPSGPNSTAAVYFGNSEIINMPIHINKQNDNPDIADIFIAGSPIFLQPVEMGEDRYTSDGNDKYAALISCFQNGIYFDVPDSKITDDAAVQKTIDRFRNSTAAACIFTPSLAGCPTTSPFNTSSKCAAVQLEFYVNANGVGMIRITNNCAVVLKSPGANDYNIVTASNPTSFHKYQIYGYHYKPNGAANQTIVPVTNTYVTQTIGSYTSDPGGQIFVNGNVIIGGDSNATLTDPNQVVKGKITIVATGNIWIADSIRVDGTHDAGIDPNGIPDANNPNFLGLTAQGVIKVVDPGQLTSSPASVAGYTYQPIGIKKNTSDPNYIRYLPDPTIVEATMTVAGGGWGAENVDISGGRRVYSAPQDYLVVHGAISEVLRGIVGHLGNDGYIKNYSYDERLSPVTIVCSEAIAGDLNGDCIVDFDDVAIMAAHWLENNLSADDPPTCTSPIEGDVNNDCSVDFVDFATIAAHWFECNLTCW